MKAKSLFKEGFNCAQSVFVPFALKQNIDKKTALKMMSPYGGGISKTDHICGAVSGGIAAIGLNFGHTDAEDTESKQKCTAATQQFIRQFKNEYGSIYCTRLIGYNLSKNKENQEAEESGIFNIKCPLLVEAAASIVEEIIKDRK
jgi:C_GCAxxG_C_C family probable redox protein